MPPLTPHSLNLVKPLSFEESPLPQKILYFFKTWGRLLIVIFQLLVVISFVARYFFDQQLLPINLSLQNQMLTLDKLKTVEDQLTADNKKLLQLKTIKAGSYDALGILVAVRSGLPAGLTLTQLNIDSKMVTLNGATPDAVNFGRLILALKSQSTFKAVTLNSATYDSTHNNFLFNLEVTL